MRLSATFVALAAPLLIAAAPITVIKRDSTSNSTDLLVLKFANVLEQLETQFYMQALSKFQESDFIAAGFTSSQVPTQQFQSIMSDESTHTTVLASTIMSLGDTPISGCSFDFSSVLTDVTTMASVARLVENVGVGAYLGAAHLVSDPVILTNAASILTIEARHQSILNVLNSGTAIPQAFDIPLLPQEVLAIAGGFISGCDTGITALPALTVTNTGSVQAGTSLTFSSTAISSSIDPTTLSCQMLAGGMPFSLSLPFTSCVVPEGLTGPVAIFVTNDTQPLNNNARDQFLGNIVAGPTMAFIDNKPEALGELARTGPGGLASTSTETISPAQASSVAASGSSSSATSAQDNGSTAAGGPNLTTGISADGATDVLGTTMVPAT